VCKHAVEAAIPGLWRGQRRRACGEGDNRAGQGREGESPREEEAQESQEGEGLQRCRVVLPTRQGDQAPAARPRRTRRPERGGDHQRAVDDPDRRECERIPATTEPCAEAERRRRQVRTGETGTAERQGRPVACRRNANRKRGKLRREATAIPVVSSSEGRTPRARLAETRQGDRDGSKASKPAGTARTQQDPEEATPGVVARHDWVALKGKETSRERQAPEDGVTAGRGTL